MTIGIDGNEANVEHRVGVSIYALSLLQHFNKKANTRLKFIIYLKNKPGNSMPPQNENFKYRVISGPLWSQIFLPAHLSLKKEIDVFFTPAHYAPRHCPVPLVVTIHDLSHFYFPNEFLKKDLYKLTNWTKYSVRKARKIIAVSENTKQDLIKFYDLPEDKIRVIYNGYEKSLHLPPSTVHRHPELVSGSYILYVGTLQPRKNVPTLIRAFDKFSKIHKDYKLVITGKKGWLFDEIFELVRELGLENKIIFTDYVNDNKLAELYKDAFCLVFPSFYEGFGIPILEAMGNSCPVISSNASSLPEVGGDACLYFNPNNDDELVEKLKELINLEKRNSLIKKGLARIKLFSWKKCADETLETIKNIL